jgi:AcrR family transcriptional regulator
MKKAERRQHILNQARDVFARRGFHAAKIDEIVAAAGIARGTFYLYFEDKRGIFEEILDRVLARIGATIETVDPHDPNRTVEGQVRDNIRRIVGILLEDRATTKIFLTDAAGVDPLFDQKLQSFYDELAKLLQGSLEDGQALGIVVEGDARLYSYLTLGALKELLYQVVVRGWDQPVDRIVDAMFGFLRDGYLRVDLVPARSRKTTA